RFAASDGQVPGGEAGQLPDGYLPMTAANSLGGLAAYTTVAATGVAAQEGALPPLTGPWTITSPTPVPTGGGGAGASSPPPSMSPASPASPEPSAPSTPARGSPSTNSRGAVPSAGPAVSKLPAPSPTPPVVATFAATTVAPSAGFAASVVPVLL